ncbi:MAG: N-acetylmuramoyl-L-alanine amidase [Rhodobacteraceae bacterium]|nr:N-acetylmuramoyl-L-alanine amidase [Paracoccaceae bacterium]
MIRRALVILVTVALCAPLAPVRAADLAALAAFDPARSRLVDDGTAVALDLALTRAVPFRAFLLNDPPRLVLDFSVVDFSAARPEVFDTSARVRTLGWGPVRDGWSRMVAEIDGPYRIETAAETVAKDGSARIAVRLVPEPPEDFVARTAGGPPPTAVWAQPEPARVEEAKRRQTGEAPLVVVLDPGHGGIDPGAEAGNQNEAAIMLTFGRELAEVLRRAGMQVILTREEDVFVPLETRISVARATGADVFLSLHADALAEGEATGATVYLLANEASDAAAARLAERHDRADLLAGVDLEGQDDLVAGVMMDLARTETQPRSDRLADDLAAAITAAGIRMHRHPIQEAAFSVLKSPDIPSILLEVGFLSSEADRKRLDDPAWRARMQSAIVQALQSWAVEDAAEARLIRQ